MARIVALMTGLLVSFQLLAAAPELHMTDVDGDVHRLSDHRGKWVVLNYWATWCPPCIGEIPELVEFHEAHKDKDAVVFGINYEQVDRELLQQFAKDYLISYPVIVSAPGEEAIGPIPGLPSTYLIAPDGRIAARKVGPITVEDLENMIAKPQE